jgi:putative MATE family efflux protein
MPEPKGRRAFDPRLLQGSIVRSLFLLAVPIAGANILQVAYQIVDAFWVGRLGAAAVAAVSITMPVMFVLVASGMGFAIAGTTLIAQYTGARDHRMADHVAAQTLLAILILSVILGGVGFSLVPWILHLLGVAPDVYVNALAFTRVIFIALPFLFLYAMVQALLRGVGEVKAPLFVVASMVAVNFTLDPILIFGKFGAPALGVMGAAIATLIAQLLASVVSMRLLFGGRYGIHVHWRDFKPDLAFIKRAFLLGYPASIEQSARGLGMTAMIFLVTSFGTVATASFGVATNMINVAVIPAMGLALATSTLVGQNLGAGNVPRAERTAHISGALTFLVLTAFGFLCLVFAPAIVAFFVPHDRAVIADGARVIRIAAWSMGFMGLQFALPAVLRAAGEMIPAMTIGLVSQWLLQLPLAFILSRPALLGENGLWWSLPVTNIGAAAMAAAWFLKGDWKTRRLIAQSSTHIQRERIEEQAQM